MEGSLLGFPSRIPAVFSTPGQRAIATQFLLNRETGQNRTARHPGPRIHYGRYLTCLPSLPLYTVVQGEGSSASHHRSGLMGSFTSNVSYLFIAGMADLSAKDDGTNSAMDDVNIISNFYCLFCVKYFLIISNLM